MLRWSRGGEITRNCENCWVRLGCEMFRESWRNALIGEKCLESAEILRNCEKCLGKAGEILRNVWSGWRNFEKYFPLSLHTTQENFGFWVWRNVTFQFGVVSGRFLPSPLAVGWGGRWGRGERLREPANLKINEFDDFRKFYKLMNSTNLEFVR